MTDGEDVGWIRLGVKGMVPPGIGEALKAGVDGEVREDGTIHVNGATFDPVDDGLNPGEGVRVMYRRGATHARPIAEIQREQERRERRRELKDRARDRAKDWKRRRAREFWNQYSIPFAWDVTIKGRRSGLSRGSWGDGRNANTVEHLYVLEAFEDGRLSRGEDCYLCDDTATLRFTEGERRQDSGGESYIPPVTCSSCLDLMDRWKVDSDE